VTACANTTASRGKWYALAEYRQRDDGGTCQGWVAGVDRDIGRNFRISGGYNFTEFSDDLTSITTIVAGSSTS
jgi:hypothetical protein